MAPNDESNSETYEEFAAGYSREHRFSNLWKIVIIAVCVVFVRGCFHYEWFSAIAP